MKIQEATLTEQILDMNTQYVRDNEILSSDMDGETVMMSIENGEYYGLNSVGSRIWTLLEEPRSMNDIITILLSEFEVEEGECKADMQHFVTDLLDKKLIKEA